jgi:hypothetical protein
LGHVPNKDGRQEDSDYTSRTSADKICCRILGHPPSDLHSNSTISALQALGAKLFAVSRKRHENKDVPVS